MKRKSCLTLALILVMVQLISVFAVLPATAADEDKTYTVEESPIAPTIDGVADSIWAQYDWSEDFVFRSSNHSWTTLQEMTAKMKLMYVEGVEATTKVDVYVMVETNNAPTGDRNCGFMILVNDGTATYDVYKTPYISSYDAVTTNQGTDMTYSGTTWWFNGTGTYDAICAQKGTYKTLEFHFQLDAERLDSVSFDVIAFSCGSGGYNSWRGYYSWSGADNEDQKAYGNLTFSRDDNISPISPKSYDVYKSAYKPTMDGKVDAIWEDYGWSDNFKWIARTSTWIHPGYSAKMKLMYVDSTSNANKVDLYLLLQTEGSANDNSAFKFIVTVDGVSYWTDSVRYNQNSIPNDTYFKDFGEFDFASTYSNDNKGFFEIHMELDKTAELKFDIIGIDGVPWTPYEEYSWSGYSNYLSDRHTAFGTLNFKDETKDVISIDEDITGASIRVDTAVWNKSGIRFRTKVNADRLAALEDDDATVTTGTLIIPTANLEAVNNVFTLEALEEMEEMKEGTHYYNLVNENPETGVKNEWVEGEDAGTWYGTLYNIRDFGRSFSAVGYVTVTYNDATTTVYGDVITRTIAGVAQEALDSDIEWTTDQAEVLNSFIAEA